MSTALQLQFFMVQVVHYSLIKNVKSFPSLTAHTFPKALSQTLVFTLRDHGYKASVSRGVPV